jgi:hypothetical protein
MAYDRDPAFQRVNGEIGFMRKRLYVCLALAIGFFGFMGSSCDNNTTSSNNNVLLDINGNSGCSIVSYLDGSAPITESGNGQFTIYNSVSKGSHSVSIYVLNVGSNGTCVFNIQNSSHDISVINPCGSGFSYTCN